MQVPNVKTQAGPTGPHPTINTTMKTSIPLPIDPLYCPRLTCFVYDNISLGFNQPLIGVFTLPIGDLLTALKEERVAELADLKDLCDKLYKIKDDPQALVPSSYADAMLEKSLAKSQYRKADPKAGKSSLFPSNFNSMSLAGEE